MGVNKSEIYQEYIAKHGAKSISYLKTSLAIDGDPVVLTVEQKRNLVSILDKAFKKAKENILKH